MKITKEWLTKQQACPSGIDWFISQSETDGLLLVKKLIAENRLAWANWLIVRVMNYKQCVCFAVFAAEQVIEMFEKYSPDDNRPRRAIEAAKKCIDNPSKKNKEAAYAAAYAAYAAADVAANAYADAVTKIKILEYGVALLEKIKEVATADDNHTKRIRND